MVYTYVKEDTNNIYSDEAVALAEAAIEVVINESLKSTIKNTTAKAKESFWNKTYDKLDRVSRDKDKKDAENKMKREIKQHTAEGKDAIGEYKKLVGKTQVNSKGEIVGLSQEERNRLAQLSNIILQNPFQ